PFGIANVPVGLLERVEVYRGVVPDRFGADALGGAINLVSREQTDNYLAASLQTGSFGGHRATLNGRYQHEPTGLFLAVAAYEDAARNDFRMNDRPFARDDGTTVERDVRRFHDAYRAYGANLQLGVVDKRWARLLVLQPYVSTFDKDLQHYAVMSQVYGAATY